MDLTHWESHSEHDLHSIHGRSFQIYISPFTGGYHVDLDGWMWCKKVNQHIM